MSGAAAAQTTDDDRDPPEQQTGPEDVDDRINPETERIARANGWKPREQFQGDPGKWVPADVFVARGLDSPAILANRNQALALQIRDMQRDMTLQNSKLDQAVETINVLTGMSRSAERRAYERARRELREEMTRAVEAGDTATWNRLEQRREELEAERPPAAAQGGGTPVPPQPTGQPNGAQPPRPSGPPEPAVQQFFASNPWYDPTHSRPDRDIEMMTYADVVHNGLKATRPDLTMEENLRQVTREVRQRFPERFNAATPRSNGHDEVNGAAAPDRRNDPPAVTPSSGGAPRRRTTNRFTFDTMPQASKDAYERYAKALKDANKGPPLTREEWAGDYWSQFQDDGNP